ncbi:hypothetical protein LWI28_028036 [Acer negundo]|uniref:Uncharacterized protein n=1 Tax=Acer negundo TaxID=4023 RepID=A0AAD5IKR8_ACENE|nr:hypothetical protein LWI28_028036 [Acer negundo]
MDYKRLSMSFTLSGRTYTLQGMHGSELSPMSNKELSQLTEYPPNDNNLKENSLTEGLGPERRGRVRGLGFGATPSQVNAQIHSGGRVKELEAKLKATNGQVASFQDTVTAVVKQNEQLTDKCRKPIIRQLHSASPTVNLQTAIQHQKSLEVDLRIHSTFPAADRNHRSMTSVHQFHSAVWNSKPHRRSPSKRSFYGEMYGENLIFQP